MKYFYIFIIFIAFNTSATTWGSLEVDDPIKLGAKCAVNEIASTGSYIYNSSSKYDQVFSPHTSVDGIWFCEDSGFIAFIGEFKNITAKEKLKISNYLEKNPQKNIRTRFSKLRLLETIYSFRTLSEELSNRNKRIFAYLYEQIHKFEIANDFRRSALNEINELLKTRLSEYKKLEYLYVAANYERQLGNVVKSDLRLTSLNKAIKNIHDEELNGFGKYLSKLSEETLRIKPGGKLAPSNEVKKTPKVASRLDRLIENVPTACKAEAQAFDDKLSHMYQPHVDRIIIEKSIAELLPIRKVLIEEGEISIKLIDDYVHYSGVGIVFKNKFKGIAESSSSCQKEINTFSDKRLLDFHQHMERVVNNQASRLVSIKKILHEQGFLKGREAIDQLVLDNITSYFTCYQKGPDAYEFETCPEKALPYKHIFKNAKDIISVTPLMVNDEVDKQKMLDGFIAIGI